MKKAAILCILIASIILISVVSAQKLDVKTTKETFKADENITFIVSLLDSQNSPIDAEVNVILESPNKNNNIETRVFTNKLSEISLRDKADYGSWKLTAKYEDLESNSLFFIEENELLKFSLEGDVVKVKNIGNIKFAKKIDILIGDTRDQKEINLDVGEETSFRLLAAEGRYNVKITGGKTSITKSDVELRGLTGNIIGTLDEEMISSDNPITGINPEEETGVDGNITSRVRNSFYIFIFVLVGAAVVLAIERHYRKRYSQKS